MVMGRCIGMDLFIRESGWKACSMVKAKCGRMIDLYRREYFKTAN